MIAKGGIGQLFDSHEGAHCVVACVMDVILPWLDVWCCFLPL